MRSIFFTAALSPLALALASCSASAVGDKPPLARSVDGNFKIEELGQFAKPWAMEFIPGTGVLLVTEKGGTIRGLASPIHGVAA